MLLASSWTVFAEATSTMRASLHSTPYIAVEKDSSALARARQLSALLPDRQNASTSGGEIEEHEFWVSNEDLLQAARLEYGPLHPELYDLDWHATDFLHPDLVSVVEACEEAARSGRRVPEETVRALLQPAGAPGVWRLPMFTEHFCTLLLEELAHYERSGIPLRRPNGMNRFGAILDQLGLSRSLQHLTRRYLRPLGQMLYPWLIARGDADEHYGFVVRYKLGEDLALAEHADASVLTLNANLGYPGFTGGALAFRGTRGVDEQPRAVPASHVDFSLFQVGDAILHLGGQYHAALPLESGERVNLVVWCFAKHDVVRFAPHDERDRLSAAQRWRAYPWEQSGAAGAVQELISGGRQGDAVAREECDADREAAEARADAKAMEEL